MKTFWVSKFWADLELLISFHVLQLHNVYGLKIGLLCNEPFGGDLVLNSQML